MGPTDELPSEKKSEFRMGHETSKWVDFPSIYWLDNDEVQKYEHTNNTADNLFVAQSIGQAN